MYSLAIGVNSRNHYSLWFLDTRYGQCHREVRGGRCTASMSVNVTKSMCCCAVTSPAGWSYNGVCERCPTAGSEEFLALCVADVGYVETPDGLIHGENPGYSTKN